MKSVEFFTAPPWLAMFPVLARIDHPAWITALDSAAILTIPSQKVIFRQGDPSRKSVLLLISGSVRVYHTSEAGREIVMYHVKSGEMCILSLAALLEMPKYAAEAQTETEVRVACIPYAQFHAAMDASAELQTWVMITLGKRLQEVTALLEDISFERVDTRIARWVIEHLEESADRVKITHSHLAGELGSTREGVGRTLKRFEQNGWIRLTRGAILVLDPGSLSKLADRTWDSKRPRNAF